MTPSDLVEREHLGAHLALRAPRAAPRRSRAPAGTSRSRPGARPHRRRSRRPPAAAPAGRPRAPRPSTPHRRAPRRPAARCGYRSASQVPMPASSPPPPTGMTTTSGAAPSCSTISAATLPCPATVRGSSKAGTRVAPVRRACSPAAALRLVVGVADGGHLQPVAAEGRDAVALLPRRGARQEDPPGDRRAASSAKATPCAWLPALAQTTPAARCDGSSWAMRL